MRKRSTKKPGSSQSGLGSYVSDRYISGKYASGKYASGKYVFVFISVFSQEGGIQSYIKDILQAYVGLNARPDTTVLLLRDHRHCHNPCKGDDRLHFRYFKHKSAWRERLQMLLWLGWICLTQRPQRVFCGHINLLPLVNKLCRVLKIPYTVLTYGKDLWENPLSHSTRIKLRQADRLWTISRYTRDRACEMNQLEPRQFDLLPCVVDCHAFTPGPKPQELIERYDLAHSKVLMTVARLWPGDLYKGVDVTIRALPKILRTQPTVKYLVIGRGDDRPRLETLAQNLGVGDRVVFAGFIPTSELVYHYRLADAYVMPSQEGFGIVYLEAMACGVPVLSGDDDGSADPLQDGRLGWQVPHRDPDAVAEACIEILRGHDRRCNGDWLREQVLASFDRSTMPERLNQLLRFPG